MKKIYIALFCLLYSQSAFSLETQANISDEHVELINLSAPLSGSIEKTHQIKAMEEFNARMSDDMMIEFFLSIPYEKRQYHFPSIHRATFISHKIKTHPQIIIWKNKKPTNIAPHLQEFAKKHLDNLSPDFYIYMDPDFWKKIPSELENDATKLKIDPTYETGQTGVDFIYPTLRELFKISNKETSYLKTSISQEDVFSLTNALTHLDLYQPQNMSFETLTENVKDMLIPQQSRAIADPFTMYALAIEKLGETESFNKFIKKYGFKDIFDFANKADKILKAYHAERMNLLGAVEIAKYRSTALEQTPTRENFGSADLDTITMYTRMHLAPIGDIYFIRKHKDILKTILNPNFISKGIIISID